MNFEFYKIKNDASIKMKEMKCEYKSITQSTNDPVSNLVIYKEILTVFSVVYYVFSSYKFSVAKQPFIVSKMKTLSTQYERNRCGLF